MVMTQAMPAVLCEIGSSSIRECRSGKIYDFHLSGLELGNQGSGHSTAKDDCIGSKSNLVVRHCPGQWYFGVTGASGKEPATIVREEEVEKLLTNKKESDEREAIFRRFMASAVPMLQRIPTLCSAQGLASSGLGFFGLAHGRRGTQGIFPMWLCLWKLVLKLIKLGLEN
ncbi:hypothetical protein U1Q18_019409 [Sarracenia purpurea var. burkii]